MLNISSSLLSLVSSRLTVAWTYLTWDAEEPVFVFFLTLPSHQYSSFWLSDDAALLPTPSGRAPALTPPSSSLPVLLLRSLSRLDD